MRGVRLNGNGHRWEGFPETAVVLPARHSLEALEDSVVLLTVAMTGLKGLDRAEDVAEVPVAARGCRDDAAAAGLCRRA